MFIANHLPTFCANFPAIQVGVVLHRDRNVTSKHCRQLRSTLRGKPYDEKSTAQVIALQKTQSKLEDSYSSTLPSMHSIKRAAHAVGPMMSNIEIVFYLQQI